MRAADALIFMCHRWDRTSRCHLDHLARTKPASFDLWVLSDERVDRAPPAGPPAFEFSPAALAEEGYTLVADDIVPGSAHLPVLEFARTHANYRFFWVVEYDVAFTGAWADILSELRQYDADLMCPHLRRHAEEPGWEWWATLRGPIVDVDRSEWLRGFMPFYRLSRRAAEVLRDSNLGGSVGHYEAAVPTCVRAAGLTVVDCGGDGEFTPPGLRGRFYSSDSDHSGVLSGSMRYRPLFRRPGSAANHLYHPVKRETAGLWDRVRHRLRGLAQGGQG